MDSNDQILTCPRCGRRLVRIDRHRPTALCESVTYERVVGAGSCGKVHVLCGSRLDAMRRRERQEDRIRRYADYPQAKLLPDVRAASVNGRQWRSKQLYCIEPCSGDTYRQVGSEPDPRWEIVHAVLPGWHLTRFCLYTDAQEPVPVATVT